MSKAKPLTAEQCEAAREAMLTGHSLSKISRCAGVVATIEYMLKDISYTLTGFDRHAVFRRQRVDAFTTDEIAGTQSARQSKDATDLILHTCELMGDRDLPILLIRRLTPLECERLQGFPDGWTDIPGASDSARYKALGNSVAIPCVDFVMKCMADAIRGSD